MNTGCIKRLYVHSPRYMQAEIRKKKNSGGSVRCFECLYGSRKKFASADLLFCTVICYALVKLRLYLHIELFVGFLVITCLDLC
mgnify:CR=1 FL=1